MRRLATVLLVLSLFGLFSTFVAASDNTNAPAEPIDPGFE